MATKKPASQMTQTELRAESLRLIDLVDTALNERKPTDQVDPWVDARLKQAQTLATLATIK